MRRWTRRQFFHTALISALGAVAAACGARQSPATPTSTAGEPTPEQPTPIPTQPGREPLTNENRPAVKSTWNVRYFRPYVPVDPELWRLTVDGLVDAPQSFSLENLMALPRITQDTRMKCVECWSARAIFAGFSYAALAEIVQPLSEAAWVYFECADGYYESLSIEELSQPRTFFAYEMDDERLLAEFGAPLRLVVPPKYGYKWPKAIARLRFDAIKRNGYWPTVGPYTPEGTVQPGYDAPVDDPGETHRISGGEITEY